MKIPGTRRKALARNGQSPVRNIGLFFFFLCSFFQLFSHENPINGIARAEQSHKVKVELSEIAFQPDGMYRILPNGSLIPISGLAFEQGEYFATSFLSVHEPIRNVG
jgi:hypothetical protein